MKIKKKNYWRTKKGDTTQKMKHTKKEKLSLKLMKFVADLKSENLKDTLEKVLNSYKYEKISAKNKFEVFDAAIEMLKDILRAYGFDLKTETIKNDPDLKQYHHETGVTPGEIINYFDSEKEKYENGKNGSDSNQWENIVQVKKQKASKIKKRKLLKFLVPTFSFLPIAISASCDSSSFSRHSITNKVPEDLKFDKSYSFTNISDEYKNNEQQIKAFRHKDSEDLYVNVNEFLKKLNGIFNTSELKINKNSDGVFEWSKGANKAIFDTKSNVIKMNTTGAFFLVRGSSTTDYSRNIKELEQKVTRLDNEKFSTLDLGKYGNES